ncbi:MAG: sigma-54-dependent Fis family transcriptional regulator [Pirellulaceae bacterium]|nr:sigma-54-dependent Fis family transcriptional regulator [Pirellulaceae bacterium]
MSVALVIDDEPSICWGFKKLLQSIDMEVVTAGTAEAGLTAAKKHRPVGLVLLDVRLPDSSGLELIEPLRAATDNAPIIIMTAHGNLETVVAAMDGGAVDYLHKPFRLSDALAACQRAIRRESLETPVTSTANGTESGHELPENRLIGKSAAMQKLFHQIALVADSDLSILITGETGTGKELVAQAIHQYSARQGRPYIAIAPATYSPALLESELFGHVRGAFTGAMDDRPGVFEIAHGGTILLDEIGELPLESQVKLLRVLEQKNLCRVGDSRWRSCDVRILAATHKDLRQAVAEGRFREDLLYRLSAVVIEIPPLRERLEDIEMLVFHFLKLAGYSPPEQWINSAVLDELKTWPWPGNVRELRNAVARAAVLARNRKLDLSDFQVNPVLRQSQGETGLEEAIQTWVARQLEPSPAAGNKSPQHPIDLYERFLEASEPFVLRAVLEAVKGNRSTSAEILGIHRATLRERLKRYGIE